MGVLKKIQISKFKHDLIFFICDSINKMELNQNNQNDSNKGIIHFKLDLTIKNNNFTGQSILYVHCQN